MRLSTGSSAAPATVTAVREAVREALRSAKEPAFAIVLCTDRYDAGELATTANLELGDVPWAGCFTAGVVVGSTILMNGIVVGIFDGSDARYAVGLGGPVSLDPRGAGRSAVAEAMQALGSLKPGRNRSVIMLLDVLTGNAAEVVRGAAHEAGAGMTWAGGGGGDNLRPIRTAQFAHGRAHGDRLVIVAIDMVGAAAARIEHGWRPYGPPTQVTQASGATAIELDFEPAFEVYQRTAAAHGDEVTRATFPRFAMMHPFGFPQANGTYMIRDPLVVEANGGLRCVAEVPDGCLVRVMEGRSEDLLEAARVAAVSAREALRGPVGGALVFDCVSRSLILGGRMPQELSAIQAGLGADVPVMGCLTFGEVGVPGSGVPQFHNKTAVVLAIPGGS